MRSIQILVLAALCFPVFVKPCLPAAAVAKKPPPAQAVNKAQAKKSPVRVLPPLERASWIWEEKLGKVCQLRKTFDLPARPTAASILITADNNYELYINGAAVGSDAGSGSEVWRSVERYDIKARLTQGRNVIGIRGTDLGGNHGVVAAIRIEISGQTPREIVTDASWHVASKADPADYSHPEFVEDEQWTSARVVGPMGMAPWGKLSYSGARRSPAPQKEIKVVLSAPDPGFRWPERVAFLADDCSVYTAFARRCLGRLLPRERLVARVH